MKQNIVINEKKYVEELINTTVLPTNIYPKLMMSYLTKYYYTDDIKPAELVKKVQNQMATYNFSLKYYEPYEAIDFVKKLRLKIKQHKTTLLRDNDYVVLYKSEYDRIKSLSSDKDEKVLFTIYILSRLFNNDYGWVYTETNNIYKLANVTKNKNDNVIARLINLEYLQDTVQVNDLKVKVDLSNGENEEIEMKIHTLKHLGNQYVCHKKPDYIMCESCGKLVKKKNKKDQRTKYCIKCAEDKQLEWQKKSMKKARES